MVVRALDDVQSSNKVRFFLQKVKNARFYLTLVENMFNNSLGNSAI